MTHKGYRVRGDGWWMKELNEMPKHFHIFTHIGMKYHLDDRNGRMILCGCLKRFRIGNGQHIDPVSKRNKRWKLQKGRNK